MPRIRLGSGGRIRVRGAAQPPVSNYLSNPSFETDSNSNGLADDWLPEDTTVTTPTYTLVSTGAVDGTRAQRMQYTGEATNVGTNKVEFYQATDIGSFAQGEPASFEVWLSGSVTGGGYAQIVIEGHTGSTYLDEVNLVVQLTANPQPFRLTHASLPAGTDSVVVVVMAVELTPTSSVDITADKATVVKSVLPALSRRINHITAPSFELEGSPPSGWTQTNSGTVTVAYAYPTTSVLYGSKKLNWASTAITSGTNNQAQLIGPTSANGSFAPGDSATFSVSVDGSLTGCSLVFQIQFQTAVGGSAGMTNSAALSVTGTPTRLSFTSVAPASTAAARVLIRVTALSTADSFNINLDGAMLEKSATADSYFDGATTGYQWMGTANASASSELLSA